MKKFICFTFMIIKIISKRKDIIFVILALRKQLNPIYFLTLKWF